MLQFTITQHIRDAELMTRIKEHFSCGYLTKDGTTKLQFRIRGINDLEKVYFLC